jgi:hypothetical protein
MVCRPAAAPEWSRDRARRQESPAPQSRSHAPIQSEVQSRLGQEESDEDQCIDDCCANVRGARLIRASETLGGRPDDDRQENPGEVAQVGKDAQDERKGQRGLADRNRVGEEPRIHAQKAVPEVDPGLDRRRLPVQSTRDVVVQMVDECGLPFEPGVDASYDAEENPQESDPRQAPGCECRLLAVGCCFHSSFLFDQ